MARVVGWLCDAEWMDVYKNIFHEKYNHARAEHILDIMAVWRTRFCGRIPVAMEATYRLLETLVNRQNVSLGAQRQMLSAAVTQFIGLLTERGFKNSAWKPIHCVADDMGIPEWMIKLRHEVAHGPLPSLAMLEKAVYFGLEWLKDKHWDKQATKLVHLSVPCMEVESESCTSLDCKLTELLQAFCHCSKHKNYNECNEIVDELENMAFYDPLVVQRLCVIFVLLEFYSQLKTTDEENIESRSKLTPEYYMLWSPILSFIKHHSQLPALLFAFIHCLCDSNNIVESNMLTGWSVYVLGVLTEQFGNNYITDHTIWSECVKLLLCNVNCHTTRLFELFCISLQHILGNEKFAKLNDLRNVFHLENSQCKVLQDDENVVYTLEDVLEVFEKRSSHSSCGDVAWKLYDGKSLEHCNIGLMPGQKRKHLYRQLLCVTGSNEDVGSESSYNQTIPEEDNQINLFETTCHDMTCSHDDHESVTSTDGDVERLDIDQTDIASLERKSIGAFDKFTMNEWDNISDSFDYLFL